MDQMFETQGINYNSIRAKFSIPKSFKTFFSNLFQPFKIARWHFEGGNWISFFPSGAEMRLRLLAAFLIAAFWKRNILNNHFRTLKLFLLIRNKLQFANSTAKAVLILLIPARKSSMRSCYRVRNRKNVVLNYHSSGKRSRTFSSVFYFSQLSCLT